jgi:hypothetical protein
MTRLLHTTPVLLVALLASTPPAFAQQQPFPDRGFIVVNGGYQITRNDFENASTFSANAEDGSFTTDYQVEGGPSFDVAGGARLWRHLAVGVGVTRFSRSTPSTLNGSVPHPFSFDRLRSVAGDVAGLKREELIVHVQARAIAPIGSRLQVMGFVGPSFFQVKQGIVRTFTWADAYPFDEATFGTATTVNAKGSKLGFHAGVDVAFFFSRQVGVGGTIQFSGTTVELESAGGIQEVKAGGARAGGGVRLRF